MREWKESALGASQTCLCKVTIMMSHFTGMEMNDQRRWVTSLRSHSQRIVAWKFTLWLPILLTKLCTTKGSESSQHSSENELHDPKSWASLGSLGKMALRLDQLPLGIFREASSYSADPHLPRGLASFSDILVACSVTAGGGLTWSS